MSTPLAQNPTHENAEIQKIILQARDAAEGRATQSSLGKDSPLVVYFSSISGNTHKFVEKLQARNVRLPLRTKDETPVMHEPYVLCVPTYGKPEGAGNVPPQVVKFLEQRREPSPASRRYRIREIQTSDLSSESQQILWRRNAMFPLLFKFELMGTPSDVEKVNKGLEEFWTQNCLQR